MNRKHFSTLTAGVLALPALRVSAADAAPLRIGMVSTMSGNFTAAAKNDAAAIAAFFRMHGDTVAGRKVEVIKRDDGGNNPETAKRLAQELIVSQNVDFLMGLVFSPNAKAVGDVSTSAKKPTFITNAASNGILEGNPYMARFSYTEGELTGPLAQWALKNGIKNVYSIVLDYATGIDAGSGFETAFTGGGGKIVGSSRVPMNSQDFSAYVQRIKDAKPQAVFCFLSVSGAAFLKAWDAAGGRTSGIRLLATGDFTAEDTLPAYGDSALGLISAMNYSGVHKSPLNAQLTREMRAVDPSIETPDFASCATYDVMQAIYKVVQAQNGGTDPDKTMQLIRGLKLESPRGPIAIDPATRDIVQTIYIRRVDNVNGRYQNTEIASYPNVRDPLEK